MGRIKKKFDYDYLIDRNGYSHQKQRENHKLRIYVEGNTYVHDLSQPQKDTLVSIVVGALEKHGLKESAVAFDLGKEVDTEEIMRKINSFRKKFNEDKKK